MILLEKMNNIKILKGEVYLKKLMNNIDTDHSILLLDKLEEFIMKQFLMSYCHIHIYHGKDKEPLVFNSIWSKKQKELFLMWIEKYIDVIVVQEPEKLKNRLLNGLKGFDIVIDSRFFKTNAFSIQFMYREVMAGILHEIGHYYHFADLLIDTIQGYTANRGRKKINYQEIVDTFITKIRNVSDGEAEIHSDNFAVQMGYGNELYSLLSKIRGVKTRTHVIIKADRSTKLINKRLESIETIYMQELDDELNSPEVKAFVRKRLKNLKNI